MVKEKIFSARGQVWIETVIYTLIGLVLIGLVLAVAMPKINEWRDRVVVDQSIAALTVFDDKFTYVATKGVGNVREVPQFYLKKGTLTFDSLNDTITLEISDLSKPYSEPGATIHNGRIQILSKVQKKGSSIYLTLNYSGVANLTFANQEASRTFTPASRPYKFLLFNLGDPGNGLVIVNVLEG